MGTPAFPESLVFVFYSILLKTLSEDHAGLVIDVTRGVSTGQQFLLSLSFQPAGLGKNILQSSLRNKKILFFFLLKTGSPPELDSGKPDSDDWELGMCEPVCGPGWG